MKRGVVLWLGVLLMIAAAPVAAQYGSISSLGYWHDYEDDIAWQDDDCGRQQWQGEQHQGCDHSYAFPYLPHHPYYYGRNMYIFTNYATRYPYGYYGSQYYPYYAYRRQYYEPFYYRYDYLYRGYPYSGVTYYTYPYYYLGAYSPVLIGDGWARYY